MVMLLVLAACLAACADRQSAKAGHDASTYDDAAGMADGTASGDARGAEVDATADPVAKPDATTLSEQDALAANDGAVLDAGRDGAALGLDGATEFCSGGSAKMVVNGVSSSPMVTTRPIVMNCCDGQELLVSTPDFEYPISIDWIMEASPAQTFPATLDLANLPKGWTVHVLIGCDPKSGRCYPPPDSYQSGLRGTLRVSRGSGGYVTTLCLQAAETPTSKHPIVHSMNLYVPEVGGP
jgi:hypothetical protein